MASTPGGADANADVETLAAPAAVAEDQTKEQNKDQTQDQKKPRGLGAAVSDDPEAVLYAVSKVWLDVQPQKPKSRINGVLSLRRLVSCAKSVAPVKCYVDSYKIQAAPRGIVAAASMVPRSLWNPVTHAQSRCGATYGHVEIIQLPCALPTHSHTVKLRRYVVDTAHTH